MTSFPVPANRPWFNSRAKFVKVPTLSPPYQLKISLTCGVIVALLSSCPDVRGSPLLQFHCQRRTSCQSCRGRPQNELPHRVGEAFVLVAVGHRARLRLHLVAGVAHC